MSRTPRLHMNLPLVVIVAWWMALVPLAWLATLRARGRPVDPGLWWIAGALGLSWIADSTQSWASTYVFPVSQAVLIGYVLLLTRPAKLLFAVGLSLVALVAVMLEGVDGPDWILYPIASFAVCAIALPLKQIPVRWPLVVYFGVGGVAWLVHVRWLVTATWYPFQMCRLVGIAWFCAASLETEPHLSLSRRAA